MTTPNNSQSINYTQDDRDRTIRMEGEVKHISKTVDEHEKTLTEMLEVTRNQTYTISGILKVQEEAARRESRFEAVEKKVEHLWSWMESAKPVMDWVVKWKWALGGIAALAVYFGWADVKSLLQMITR